MTSRPLVRYCRSPVPDYNSDRRQYTIHADLRLHRGHFPPLKKFTHTLEQTLEQTKWQSHYFVCEESLGTHWIPFPGAAVLNHAHTTLPRNSYTTLGVDDNPRDALGSWHSPLRLFEKLSGSGSRIWQGVTVSLFKI